jgi:hypothetical protein
VPFHIKKPNNFKTFNRVNKENRVIRASSFFKTILRDNSILSTTSIGKEVYNIKDKETSIILGYLEFLVNKEKLNSLSSYIINLGLKFNLVNFFVIISYPLENKYLYIKVYKGISFLGE